MTLDDIISEAAYFLELQRIDNEVKFNYARVGIICRDVKNRLLWQRRIDPSTGEPFRSMAKWVRAACPWSYATTYAALRDVEELKDIPEEVLAQIPASNFPIVKQLSTAVRSDPVVIEAAQTKPTDEFIEQIKESHPEQHFETKTLLRFQMEESAAKVVEDVLRVAMGRGAATRSEALEMICAEAVDSWRSEDEVLEAGSRMEMNA